jgi:hypothetical protein
MMPNTELEPVAQGEILLVTGLSFSLSDVADKITAPLPDPPFDEALPFPGLPKRVELTEHQRQSLGMVARVFGSLSLDSRRSLLSEELEDLALEADTLADLEGVLKDRREEIKEIIRVHMDVDAEEQGVAVPRPKLGPAGGKVVEATPRDRKGHYLLAEPSKPLEVHVGGFRKGWQQRFTSGSVALSAAALDELYEAGAIDRKEYLACTAEQRSLDEAKLHAFIRKNPVRGLGILRRITRRGPANSALYGPEE